MRLLEITAASINALAGELYLASHPGLDIKPPCWPKHGDMYDGAHEMCKRYVDFYHTQYRDYDKYPVGLLNVVGY